MESHDLCRAVAAARATVSELGLDVSAVVVVQNSDRVVLRLLPCDVLARVAPPGHLAESEFEVEVARRLAGTGAPVGGLDPRTPPLVHARDSFAVSLWTYHVPVASGTAPADYARTLERHHAALRRTELAAPHVTDRFATALAQVSDHEHSPELPVTERELIRDTLTALGGAVGADRSRDQLLHGEPHPGNLLQTRHGPLLVDLATCCRGPVEFDLAHAPEQVAAHYAGADPDLLDRCRALNWALFSAWRWRAGDGLPERDRWRAHGLERLRAARARCRPS